MHKELIQKKKTSKNSEAYLISETTKVIDEYLSIDNKFEPNSDCDSTRFKECYYCSDASGTIYYSKYVYNSRTFQEVYLEIGNIAYNDRNGNQLQDDGYRYRGRGLIQITGRAKYQEFTDYALKHDWIEASVNFVKTPDIVSTSGTYAILSAIYYWQKNGCDIIAKKDDNSVGTYSYKKNNNKFTGSFNNAVAKIAEKINGVSKVNLDNRANNFEKLYKSQTFNEFP